MEGITYSLKDKQEVNSNNYYLEIASFTDRVLEKAAQFGEEAVHKYVINLESIYNKKLAKEEGLLEFLLLGVLGQTYLPTAIKSSKIIRGFLHNLTEIRYSYYICNKVLDPLRGILATCVYADFQKTEYPNQSSYINNSPEHLKELIAWLAATGEFDQEVKRLKLWYDFLSIQPANERSLYLEECLRLANWFKITSNDVLGKYTSNVESFLNEQGKKHYWSEDVILCNRKRIEYHLNMVGAEILNRVYREAYLKARQKIIALPACLRQNSTNCRAEKNPFGYRCQYCNPVCSVNTITRTGVKNGFEVYIIPHKSMLFSRKATKDILGEDVAIIGIACALNLISGGWKAIEMEMAAQCVLLDYCGCQKHWDNDENASEINLERLIEMMNNEEITGLSI